jgi:hypothetical protein
MSLKYRCEPTDQGYYTLTHGVAVPVRLFLNEKLYAESEEGLYVQVKTATELPGVFDVFRATNTVLMNAVFRPDVLGQDRRRRAAQA